MMRWLQWTAAGLLVVCTAGYAGDLVIFMLRGSPLSKVTVSQFISAPLKNNKQELDYLGSEEVPCSISLFPEAGNVPCWYLRRHKNQVNTL